MQPQFISGEKKMHPHFTWIILDYVFNTKTIVEQHYSQKIVAIDFFKLFGEEVLRGCNMANRPGHI